MRRLVLFVEGQGDVLAAPSLVGKIQSMLPDELRSVFFIDPNVFKVGNLSRISGQGKNNWIRYLETAKRTRSNLGAVLTLLDGDSDLIEGQQFCATVAAKLLAERAKECGAGVQFSFAMVFLRQEFESLLIAVAKQYPQLKQPIEIPENVEEAPRDAKGWLNSYLEGGYRSVSMQRELIQAITDWLPLQKLRCFRRLQHAIQELSSAIANNVHISSPSASELPGAPIAKR